MKKIAVVILNFNGEKDTLECLESFKNISCEAGSCSARQCQIIVVDNGSKEKFKIQPVRQAQGKRSKFKVQNIKVISSDENLGFSGGNNLGIKEALKDGADYVLVLNNDTIIDSNLIKELVEGIEQNSKIGVAAPKIYFEKGYEFHKDRYKKKELGKVLWYAGGVMDWNNVLGSHKGVDEVDNGQYEKVIETDFASGCCMLIKKEVLQKVGLFDEKYFLYYEDADLGERVKSQGFKIVYFPKAILWHKNAGSAGGSGSSLQDYYITRNRMLFGMRYAPFKSKLSLLKESMFLLIKGRTWQKKAVLDFYLGRFGKGSYH